MPGSKYLLANISRSLSGIRERNRCIAIEKSEHNARERLEGKGRRGERKMAKNSAGRLGEGPSRRPRIRQRSEFEPQTAVIEDVGGGELEEIVEVGREYEEHGAAANSRERTDSVGHSRNGSISMILSDPEVLDCLICCDPLTIPVFQCENGHVACSSCCSKLRNKCPSCRSPTGYIRCRAIEKVLESAKVICKNSKYGCKETTIYNQRHDHEKTCHHAPCSCPLSDCGFVGSSIQLYRHFMGRHATLAVPFHYNKVFHIALNIYDEFLVLQEERDGVLFILQNHSAAVGNMISLSRIAPSWNGGCFYDILARLGESSLRFLANTNSIEGRVNCPPSVQGSLQVPSSFFDSRGLLRLDICIWRCGIHPELIVAV